MTTLPRNPSSPPQDTTRQRRAIATVSVWPATAIPARRHPKVLLSLRIDHDVLEWFRAQGPGYQTRMNAVLRAYVEHARGKHTEDQY